MNNKENNDWKAGIQTLLSNTRIAFLSTQGDISPETSMCPYAVFQGDMVLHLSALAKHSKNLSNSQHAGLMICTPESADFSPLALPRLSFTGHIEAVPEDEQAAYKKAYLQNIPDAEPLFSFPDFTLYRFKASAVFWVGGFGKARQIPLETWKSIC
ncbi:pyridoxamine 5'-phosphate oxidase family protein [Ghiorsea bivora]|uniref:pyridoxamine 5'-phosphate oxidase family protein n=1 Tax=Ghiorsea bivora TaxID=1485545 RepID=UPI00056EF3D4|nr:pyridoxamine 5'-phosphate oxidase family protein [Ghiorsea bivora]